MRSLKRVLREEKGVVIIFVAIAIVVIFGFAVLAIDASLMQLAKTQLQNAADAGALAGANILALNNGYTNGPAGNANQEAIRIAGLNVAIQDVQRPVVISEDDITNPKCHYTITVTTHRTKTKGDPITLHFMKVLGSENKGEMTATSTATVFPISGTDCLKPWCIPDRWNDRNGNHKWDSGEYYHPDETGYKVPDDLGRQVTLYPSKSEKWEACWYFAVDFPPLNTGDPVTGADAYRRWISECEPYAVSLGDQLQTEPGTMNGPTRQGLEDLLSQDPNAVWDPVKMTVINSAFPTSPRIVKITAFNPTLGLPGPGRSYVVVSKMFVVFVEGFDKDANIVGRFMKMSTDGELCPGCSQGFLYKLALVD